MFPFAEFIWQPAAAGAGAEALAGAGAVAHAGITGYIVKNAAVVAASACRRQLRVLCRLAVVLVRLGYVRLNFTEVSFGCVVGGAVGAGTIWLNYAFLRGLALLGQEIPVNLCGAGKYILSEVLRLTGRAGDRDKTDGWVIRLGWHFLLGGRKCGGVSLAASCHHRQIFLPTG